MLIAHFEKRALRIRINTYKEDQIDDEYEVFERVHKECHFEKRFVLEIG